MKKKEKRARKWKEDQVASINGLLGSYDTIGLAKIRGLGSKQLQRIRKEFRGDALLRVSKNSMISRSFREKGMNDMVDFIDDQMALIFTDLDAFELYKVMEKGKIPAPIKAGAVAPQDIVIEEGPTSLRPGPVVGELQNLGIPAGIDGGKVVVKQRKVAVEGGERVSPELADMLAKLEIYPITEGVDLCAVYDLGESVLFSSDVLHVDTSKYLSDVTEAARAVFSLATNIKYDYPTRYTIGDMLREANAKSQALAFNCAYPTSETIEPLIQKAYTDARNLSINACIYESETIALLLAKACSQAQSLAAQKGMEK
ncbi:large subunit ribosomal protein L10 [Methanophagales archaeon]|nr:large subunit ribosomal protein L10 [Methanophagales archaeon]